MNVLNYENADQFMKVAPLVDDHFRNRSDTMKAIADSSIRAMINEDVLLSNLKPIESYLTLELISSLEESILIGKIESVDNTTLDTIRIATTIHKEELSNIKDDKDAKRISETLNSAFEQILKVTLKGKKKLLVNDISVKAGYIESVDGNKMIKSISYPEVIIEIRGEVVKQSK